MEYNSENRPDIRMNATKEQFYVYVNVSFHLSPIYVLLLVLMSLVKTRPKIAAIDSIKYCVRFMVANVPKTVKGERFKRRKV